MSATTTQTRTLERETCSRCGGSGHFSYCQMYGTRCFKCNGAKQVLTKRGAAAMAYLKGLRSRRADQLKPGDKVKMTGIGSGWSTVIEVRPGDASRDGGFLVDGVTVAAAVIVDTNLCKFHTSADRVFEILLSKEEQQATLTAALEYQDTLTKQGKPRKS